MTRLQFAALPLLALAVAVPVALALRAPAEAAPVTPSGVVAAAPAAEWVAIAPSDLMVMDLAPAAVGKPRRVVIQLMPAPFSQGWVGNIRKLVAARWYDGISVNRVQDNYVVQWGDASEKKALPKGLLTVPESEYVTSFTPAMFAHVWDRGGRVSAVAGAKAATPPEKQPGNFGDPYADAASFVGGMPVAMTRRGSTPGEVWPVHCYGMVGVGRDVSPNTGSGAELYVVIGHAPRHLDRNIAVVGRVVQGIEHLSSLPRGTGQLGFYESAGERVPIVRVRMAGDLPEAERPRLEYLSTESASFAAYAAARANRQDDFFIRPAGGADICNIPVPIRTAPGG